MLQYPAEVRARGSRGTTIIEYWEAKEGPQAYLGACYPGFPNLYTLLGALQVPVSGRRFVY